MLNRIFYKKRMATSSHLKVTIRKVIYFMEDFYFLAI